MFLGLDISTSITGATILGEDGKIVYNNSWDTRKFKNFFEKAKFIEDQIKKLDYPIKRIYIEQSLQSFRSGFSSAKTLSTLSRFNGVVSWLAYTILRVEPEYLAASSARKLCGIKIPKGQKAKQVVLNYVIDNVPDVLIEYTKHGNPRPDCFDKADSWVVARAGYALCQQKQS
tara:strand:+ start:627 stop:1145 length:519 start_codon:yes stop_codon:yes gene_type:complete